MYGPIPEVSPGAASLNSVIRLRRAQERTAIIGRSKRGTLAARLAEIADRDGVIGRRAS